MKIQKEDLVNSLKPLGRAVGKSPLAILGCVLIQAGPGSMMFSTSNLQATMVTLGSSLPDYDGERWSAAVPYGTFTQWVNSLGDDLVTLRAEEKFVLRAQSGRTRTTFKGIDPAEFPGIENLPEPGRQGQGENVTSLINAIVGVSYAALGDLSRPELSTINLEFGRNRVVATDGFRLAVANVPGMNEFATHSVLIPKDAAKQLKAAAFGEEVGVEVDEKSVTFWDENTAFRTQLVDANYPDVDRIYPVRPVYGAKVLREELAGALKTASTIRREGGEHCTIWTQTGKMIIDATSDGISSRVTIDGDELGFGRGLNETTVNLGYLTDVVTNDPGEYLVIGTAEQTSSAVMCFTGNNDHIIVPLLVPQAKRDVNEGAYED